jgi:delta 1-pyrroline-5-carboxylate dehydrogenase
VSRVNVGNLYINRNQIGAVVGSQPFGGHGLSGTGPKAGGPRYLPRFARTKALGSRRPLTPLGWICQSSRKPLPRKQPKQSHVPERFTRPHRRIEPLPLAAQVTRAVHGPRRRNPCTKRPRHGMLRHCRRGYDV